MDKVGVVILNYKNYDLTNTAIASLVRSSLDNTVTMAIYIVDNHSGNDSLKKIETYVVENSLRESVEIHLIQSQVNGGYAKGINLGIREALEDGCTYVATVNPDITVKEDTLQKLLTSLKASDLGMIGPKIYDHDGVLDRTCARKAPTLAGYFFRLGLIQRLFPKNPYISAHYIDIGDMEAGIVDADVVSGAFMFFKSSVIKEIDCFDENTFLYNEEFIIHARLKAHGHKTGVDTASIALHLGGGSSQDVTTSKFLFDSEMNSLDYYMDAYRNYPYLLRRAIIANIRMPFLLRTLIAKG